MKYFCASGSSSNHSGNSILILYTQNNVTTGVLTASKLAATSAARFTSFFSDFGQVSISAYFSAMVGPLSCRDRPHGWCWERGKPWKKAWKPHQKQLKTRLHCCGFSPLAVDLTSNRVNIAVQNKAQWPQQTHIWLLDSQPASLGRRKICPSRHHRFRLQNWCKVNCKPGFRAIWWNEALITAYGCLLKWRFWAITLWVLKQLRNQSLRFTGYTSSSSFAHRAMTTISDYFKLGKVLSHLGKPSVGRVPRNERIEGIGGVFRDVCAPISGSLSSFRNPN